jgi:tetratricopeptide (TPR) repeat protein
VSWRDDPAATARHRAEVIETGRRNGLLTAVPQMSPRDFDEASFRRLGAEGKPYVVRGYTTDWPLAKLTREGLIEEFGHLQVLARTGDYVGKAFTPERDAAPMSLAEYLNEDHGPAGTLPSYVGNQQLPELAELCEWPPFFGHDVEPKIWLGVAGTVTPLHADYDDNLFAQLWGQKRFWLYPPHHAEFLYTREANPMLVASKLDPEAPDFEGMPLARKAVGIECVVEAGDLLYLPAGWFHHVRSLTLSLSANRWTFTVPLALAARRKEEMMEVVAKSLSELVAGVRDIAAELRRLNARLPAVQHAASAVVEPPPPPTQGEDAVAKARQLVSEGHVWSQKKAYEEAARCYRAALRLTPKDAMVLNNLGFVSVKLGDHDVGRRLLREAIALNPRLRLAYNNLRGLLTESGSKQELFDFLREMTSAFPDDRAVIDHLIGTALRLERWDDVVEYSDRLAGSRWPSRFFPVPRTTDPPRGEPVRMNVYKLRHDFEQFSHLEQLGLLPREAAGASASLGAVLRRVEQLGDERFHAMSEQDERTIGSWYSRIVYRRPTPALPRAISTAWNREAVVESFKRTGIAVIDGLLTPEALQALRQFCVESTVWHMNKFGNGYLGAYLRDGFCTPLHLQIARELREALPALLEPHPLTQAWGFKYDSLTGVRGINVHADFAAVNVNFWVTDDEANLDKETGGLVIYDVAAPLEWTVDEYNKDVAKIYRLLQARNAKATNVPYRTNRAVIFDSDLFHETASLSFRPGYLNRRINVTMLYGLRHHGQTPGVKQSSARDAEA